MAITGWRRRHEQSLVAVTFAGSLSLNGEFSEPLKSTTSFCRSAYELRSVVCTALLGR